MPGQKNLLIFLAMLIFTLGFKRLNKNFAINIGCKNKIGDSPQTETSTWQKEEDIISEIKRLKKINGYKKIFNLISTVAEQDFLSEYTIISAHRTFLQMNKTDFCLDLFPFYNMTISKKGRVDFCETILDRFHLKGNTFNIEDISARFGGSPVVPGILLSELCLAYSLNGKVKDCINTIESMVSLNSISISLDQSKKVMQYIMKKASLDDTRRVLRGLLQLGGLSDNDSIQLFSNIFMKNITFVKGAVSMETLPPANTPEIAFIGRSNVGKSSLVNMIANRKKLAFTSKTPGKTSEYNYFLSSGEVGAKKEKYNFYLVDLPGVGYAEVERTKKENWVDLLQRYTTDRVTLRALFHLIDSRHGVLEADFQCFSLLKSLPENVKYVIILTKYDKLENQKENKRTIRIVENIRRDLLSYGRDNVPILLTSSETRAGGCACWSAILDTISGNNPISFL